jgi:hypothetical protein
VCKSACTLFLGIRNVCVERSHHMDTDAFHTLPGSTLIDRFGYRECPPM